MCENYFSYEENGDFWYEFSRLSSPEESRYLLTRASNIVSCQCIKFPEINEPTVLSSFFPNKNGSSDTLIFKNCIFSAEADFSKLIKIKNVTFIHCQFFGNVDLSLINFQNISIESSEFHANVMMKSISVKNPVGMSGHRTLNIKNSIFNADIKIIDCELNDAELFNVNFKKANLIFDNTSLEGLKLNAIHWGKKFLANRDTFRQLKVILESNKNYIDSNLFHSLEMNEYKKELSKISSSHYEDKFIFWINSLVSDFSRSWFRPLFWLILFSILLYGSLCCFNYIEQCSFNNFMHFFNPLSRSTNERFENVYGIWFLHKILAGFFVYHFVVALKRKTKI